MIKDSYSLLLLIYLNILAAQLQYLYYLFKSKSIQNIYSLC